MVSVAAKAGGPAARRLPPAPRSPLILFLAVTPLCRPVGGGWQVPPGLFCQALEGESSAGGCLPCPSGLVCWFPVLCTLRVVLGWDSSPSAWTFL